MAITIDGHRVASSRCVKYLAVHIDSDCLFTEHARTVATKASKV